MNGKTSISALQELMAARGHPLPVYHEEGFGTSFTCTVYVEGITAVGQGTSKKSAKHESARLALEKLQGVKIEDVNELETPAVQKPLKNYVGDLNEYSSKNGLPYPGYEFITAMVNGQFIYKCNFGGKEVEGVGMNKKDAKQDSARKMLELVTENVDLNCYKLVPKKAALELDNSSAEEVIEMFKQLTFQKKELRVQNTITIESNGEIEIRENEDLETLEKQLRDYGLKYTVRDFQHHPYVVSLVIDGTHFTFLATGNTKEEALKKVYTNLLEVKKTGCSLSHDFN